MDKNNTARMYFGMAALMGAFLGMGNKKKVKVERKPRNKHEAQNNAYKKRARMGRLIHNDGQPIVKKKAKKRTTFTGELRKQRGYDERLAERMKRWKP